MQIIVIAVILGIISGPVAYLTLSAMVGGPITGFGLPMELRILLSSSIGANIGAIMGAWHNYLHHEYGL
jgi:hypothetical protein